ncbi:transcriptional regulator, LuxR family [Candidatus Moduliflexus flocculans]|uniref:Transcriptional regulator, LuxR family n=1 Tax=Candidatus Moduliflexus flocculans TaxID=1499966 RepID=A0A081BLX0_9BACT|nr:transcriptional regulator, LuxR family [Candidatus Moduliflexus flocculans]
MSMLTTFSRSITWKIHLTMIVSILLVMTMMGGTRYWFERRAIYADALATAKQIAKRLEQALIQPVWEFDDRQIELVIALEMSSPHVAAIIFEAQRQQIKIGQIRAADGVISRYQEAQDRDGLLSKHFQIVDTTIRRQDYQMGTVKIYLTDRGIRQELFRIVAHLGGQFFALSCALYLALFWGIRYVILRPIAMVDATVQRFAAKEFETRVPVRSRDELGRLAERLNSMAETIGTYQRDLEAKVRERTQQLEESNSFQIQLRTVVEQQRDQLAHRMQELEEALTQKQTAYAELEEMEQRFRTLADDLPSVIAEIDLNGKFIYLNHAGQEFFAISSDDAARGISLDRFLPDGEHEQFRQRLNECKYGGTEQNFQNTFISADKKQHVAIFKTSPIFHQHRVTGLRMAILEVHATLDLLVMPGEAFYAAHDISDREKEVLTHLVKGLKNKEIGEKLYITEITVKKHVSSILQKTDCKNRQELLELLKRFSPKAS